jgi:hypothetical protein
MSLWSIFPKILKAGAFKQTTEMFHRISLKAIAGVAFGHFSVSQF